MYFLSKSKRASQVLQDLGLVKYDKDKKRFQTSQKQIGLDHSKNAIALNRYHQKVCEMTSEAVVKVEESGGTQRIDSRIARGRLSKGS